ncbi:MAG: hypothetical protein KDA17_07110, partial [Candidatus Saccharibacteria bacterium]|nr:hypothetical protein [Candidatus Saccharibacteria bacterium]
MSTSQKVLEAMASYHLKKTGSNQYRSRSPFRPDSDSPSFALTIEDNEHGTWFDHAADSGAGRGGSLYELAQHLGIDTPKIQAAVTKRKYDGIADYAAAHGITVEQMQRYGWKEVQYQGRQALEYPTNTGKRWRFLDGGEPRYKSGTGYKPCWYGLGERLRAKIQAGAPLVIANGEISVVTATEYGLAAACVTSG